MSDRQQDSTAAQRDPRLHILGEHLRVIETMYAEKVHISIVVRKSGENNASIVSTDKAQDLLETLNKRLGH